jgi:hypothetical protein
MRQKTTRKLVAAMTALALAGASLAAPAAFGDPPKKQCNSGGGNGTETCNPGNSSGHGNPHDEG